MSQSSQAATSPSMAHATRMEAYYRFHAPIYDATRWSFLFGRNELIRRISALTTPVNILEIGCGTGKNLIRLNHYFPQAKITGLDASASMLKLAHKNLGPLAQRVSLLHQVYDCPLSETDLEDKFDLILCMYSLSMMNPGWEQVIASAHHDLNQGGFIAVVDFHNANWPLFKWLMRIHVRLNGHLLPKLQTCFQTQFVELRPAYGGFWQYLLFAGHKPANF